jgi:CO/xanthine dehydrogenase FAD-binding subunit
LFIIEISLRVSAPVWLWPNLEGDRFMKPPPFDYLAPASLDQALAAMAQYGYDAKPLAGGQSLVPLMNFRLAQPSVLVDLNMVDELFYIRPGPDGGIRIGAMTRYAQVEHDPVVANRAPLLHDAVPLIAYTQIRNRGTIGGSLAHADPSAEMPSASVALNGQFRLQSQSGDRWVPAADFFLGLFTTALEPDELLVEIALPPLPPRTGWSFMEVARRKHDFAMAGVATIVTLEAGDTCQAVRMVFFSVGDGPMVAHKAAAMLQGERLTPELIEAAAHAAAAEDIDPGSDIHATADFRRHLSEVLARRALAQAAERARAV